MDISAFWQMTAHLTCKTRQPERQTNQMLRHLVLILVVDFQEAENVSEVGWETI